MIFFNKLEGKKVLRRQFRVNTFLGMKINVKRQKCITKYMGKKFGGKYF